MNVSMPDIYLIQPHLHNVGFVSYPLNTIVILSDPFDTGWNGIGRSFSCLTVTAGGRDESCSPSTSIPTTPSFSIL